MLFVMKQNLSKSKALCYLTVLMLPLFLACKKDASTTSTADFILEENIATEQYLGSYANGTIFGNIIPNELEFNDTRPITVGVKFKSSKDGYISGVRFFRDKASNRAYSVALWTAEGQLLAEGNFIPGEGISPAKTWIEIPFTKNRGTTKTEVRISANTTYIASYYCLSGGYVAKNEGLENDIVGNTLSGSITALGGLNNNGNGVFKYATPNPTSPRVLLNEFPNESFRNTNYYVDVLYSEKPTLTSNIFGDYIPQEQESPDRNPVTVGVKFKSSIDGFISGVRFYRDKPSSRAYSVALWTLDGQLLARGAFGPGEGGLPGKSWFEVPFTTNDRTGTKVTVPIKANTTYIASYYCLSGGYVAKNGGLDNDISNPNSFGGVITALGGLTNQGNGVYKYATPNNTIPVSFLEEFPNQTYLNTNYYVDVIFNQ